MKKKLSKLEKINLREIWKNEKHDFSNWLFEEESINILSEELGIAINPKEKEANAGKYYIDILRRRQRKSYHYRKSARKNQSRSSW